MARSLVGSSTACNICLRSAAVSCRKTLSNVTYTLRIPRSDKASLAARASVLFRTRKAICPALTGLSSISALFLAASDSSFDTCSAACCITRTRASSLRSVFFSPVARNSEKGFCSTPSTVKDNEEDSPDALTVKNGMSVSLSKMSALLNRKLTAATSGADERRLVSRECR